VVKSPSENVSVTCALVTYDVMQQSVAKSKVRRDNWGKI
jgi:hypothetical protein